MKRINYDIVNGDFGGMNEEHNGHEAVTIDKTEPRPISNTSIFLLALLAVCAVWITKLKGEIQHLEHRIQLEEQNIVDILKYRNK